MSKKPGVCYDKPEEPAFLRRIKQQLGYKAPATINEKVDFVLLNLCP
jgi:hypothetical protein